MSQQYSKLYALCSQRCFTNRDVGEYVLHTLLTLTTIERLSDQCANNNYVTQ